MSIPDGCAFHPRCGLKEAICAEIVPPLLTLKTPDRRVACHVVNRIEGREPDSGIM
jgi:ABC-type dipeptide/oligopeptide/nickel transport system ATPase component